MSAFNPAMTEELHDGAAKIEESPPLVAYSVVDASILELMRIVADMGEPEFATSTRI